MKDELKTAQRFALMKMWDVIETAVYQRSAGCPKAMREINEARRRAFAGFFYDGLEISPHHSDEEAA